MHSSLLIILLIWLQVNLFGLEANKLLHFLIALISFSLENRVHNLVTLLGILSKSWRSTSWDWVELKKLWRVFHKSSNLIYSWPLNCIALTAGSLCFLIQFISSHRPHLLLAISVILSSKKMCLDFLTVFLNSFQSSKLQDCWYL